MTADSDAGTARRGWSPAERLWVDPTRARKGEVLRRGRVPVVFGWPLKPVVLRARWAVREVGVRREPGCLPHGHARGVWEHMSGLVGVAVAQGRLRAGDVDADLEFLSLIAGHVVGCRVCRIPDPNVDDDRGATPQDVLWLAVRKVGRLRQLAGSLDEMGDGDG